MTRLTFSGLHIATAVTLSVYAHAGKCLESTPYGCFYHRPGVLPAMTVEGDLHRAIDPITDYKGRPWGNPSRSYLNVTSATIALDRDGAHVVWTEQERTPSLICGGSHDVNFDGSTDIFDLLYFQAEQVDWDENGVFDIFDFILYLEGF